MMVLVVTTGAVSRTKLQSNRHRQQTNTQLYTGQVPSRRPTNSVGRKKTAYTKSGNFSSSRRFVVEGFWGTQPNLE